ncbi:MAG: hypothetical protein QM692_05760 [Thermomicrobiales bacterium]
MDSRNLDALARLLAAPGSRRAALGLLGAVPAALGLVEIAGPDAAEAGRRKRRRKRHSHGKGRRRNNQRGKKKKAACQPEPIATTCSGKCGALVNTCGDTVNCGGCPSDAPVCANNACVPCSGANPCPDSCCKPDGTCGGVCRVFVSSSKQNGNMGGLAGADAICQQLADGAGLPGRFMAWLSDSVDSPSTRFPLAGSAAGPYALPGLPYAELVPDWEALVTCASPNVCFPVNPDRTELGTQTTDAMIYTATTTAGQPAGASCGEWRSTDGVGVTGDALGNGPSWTTAVAAMCTSAHPIYCFQQG